MQVSTHKQRVLHSTLGAPSFSVYMPLSSDNNYKAASVGGRVAARHASKKSSDFSSWLRSVAIAVAVVALLRLFVFGVARVDGPSMRLTFLTGDRLIYSKLSYVTGAPQRGDIVVCKYPHYADQYVKRVIALPGETVEGRNSVIYVNGEPLAEHYLSAGGGEDFEPVVVPADHYFVVGDNRDRSSDSRMKEIGPIDISLIEGKAVLRIWPLDAIKTMETR